MRRGSVDGFRPAPYCRCVAGPGELCVRSTVVLMAVALTACAGAPVPSPTQHEAQGRGAVLRREAPATSVCAPSHAQSHRLEPDSPWLAGIDDYLHESTCLRKAAVSLYEQILAEDPTYHRNDEMMFNLALVELEAGHTSRAIMHYRTLVKRFPDSPLAGKSYLLLGDYFFDQEKLGQAEKAYRRALVGTEPRGQLHALYRLAWCDFRQQRVQSGIKKLKSVVARSQAATDRRSRELGDIVLSELARFFSYADDVEDALDYYGRDRDAASSLSYAGQLAQFLHQQGKWSLEVKTYRYLLERHPLSEVAPYLQASLLKALNRLDRYDQALLEAEHLIRRYGPDSAWHEHQGRRGISGAQALERASEIREVYLRDVAFDALRGVRTRSNPSALARARALCALYLRAFPGSRAASQMWRSVRLVQPGAH